MARDGWQCRHYCFADNQQIDLVYRYLRNCEAREWIECEKMLRIKTNVDRQTEFHRKLTAENR